MNDFFNNEAFRNFVNSDYNMLARWLNTLDPYEFTIIGVIIAFLIAPTLNPNQQNSIGNFLEVIGQTLLTISAQEITVLQANKGNTTSNGEFDTFNGNNNINGNINLNNEINNLRQEINRLRNEINRR